MFLFSSWYVLWISVKHSHSSLIFGSFSLRWGVKIDKVNAILILSVWVSATQPDKFLPCSQTGFSFWWFSESFFLCLWFYAFAKSQIWRWLLQLFFVLWFRYTLWQEFRPAGIINRKIRFQSSALTYIFLHCSSSKKNKKNRFFLKGGEWNISW